MLSCLKLKAETPEQHHLSWWRHLMEKTNMSSQQTIARLESTKETPEGQSTSPGHTTYIYYITNHCIIMIF